MSLYWELATEIIDQVSNTIRGCYTQKEERGVGIYAISAFSEQKVIHDIVAQEGA